MFQDMTLVVASVNEFPPEFEKNYYYIKVNEVKANLFMAFKHILHQRLRRQLTTKKELIAIL